MTTFYLISLFIILSAIIFSLHHFVSSNNGEKIKLGAGEVSIILFLSFFPFLNIIVGIFLWVCIFLYFTEKSANI